MGPVTAWRKQHSSAHNSGPLHLHHHSCKTTYQHIIPESSPSRCLPNFVLLHTNHWSLKLRDEKKGFLFDQMGNGGGGSGVGIVGKEEGGKGRREGRVGVEVRTSEVNRRGAEEKQKEEQIE